MTPEGKSDRRRAIAGWALALLIVWVLLDVLVGGASLVIDVDSTAPGQSQIYYRSVEGRFSDQDIVRVPLQAGKNELTFALPHVQQRVRWHLINGAATLDVHGIRAKVWWSTVQLPLETVRSGFHVGSSNLIDNRTLHVETAPGETGPQVFVTLPVVELFFLRQLGAASVAALALGLLFLCVRLDERATRAVETLKRVLAEERPALRALPYLIAIAFAFHFSSLAAFSLSPDDEYAAFRTNADVWVTQGRWTAYLVEGFILTQPTVPFLPDAIFCVCAALSYVLLVRAHGLGITWRTYASFPIFCAFPTWAYIAEFYGNLPSISLGLLFASAGALVFQRTFVSPAAEPQGASRSHRVAAGMAAQALLLAVAMGTYQSYLPAFVTFGLGIVLVTAHTNPGVSQRRIGTMLLALIATSAAGYCFYASIQKLMLAVTGVRMSYVDQFLQPALLLAHPVSRFEFVVEELKSIYSGAAALYGTPLGCLGIVVVLGVTSILCAGRISDQGFRKTTLLLLGLSVLALPIALMAIAPDLPLRALVGVPYAAWLFGVLALTHQLQIPRVAGTLAVLASGFQIAYVLSSYAATTTLMGSHDRMLAEAVYERIAAANENFDRRTPYPVDFFGAKSMNMPRYPTAPTSTMGSSFFDWDGGNTSRMVSYMNLLGYDNLRMVDASQRALVTPEFADMPAWPAQDSVKVVAGITLVKLSYYPDPTHLPSQ